MTGIQSVGKNGSWLEFMRASEAARRRNIGLVAPEKPREGLPPRHVGRSAAGASAPASAARFYLRESEPRTIVQTAGSKFDAYA
jgi:hypothetical protein